MKFRTRLLMAFVPTALIPLGVFAFGVRRSMNQRLADEYARRVDALIAVIERGLQDQSASIAMRIHTVAATLADDNRFRAATVTGTDREYALDFAGRMLGLTGLSMLQIQDRAGRIVSSGHFRNEFDRIEASLPERLASVGGGLAIVRARSATGAFPVLARLDSTSVAGVTHYVIGGVTVADVLARVSPGGELAVHLDLAAGPARDSIGTVVRSLTVPLVAGELGDGGMRPASIRVVQTTGALASLRREIDLWFAGVLAAAAGGMLLVTVLVAGHLSRPLVQLADQTQHIDIDKLEFDAGVQRSDEVGALARLLAAMTARLRRSTARMRDVERRSAIGEMARQVNHDIKNGLVPIRNVVRHLTDVARDQPADLAPVFEDRRGTLDTSISYLEDLSANYARLYPKLDRKPIDVNDVIRHAVPHADRLGAASLELKLGESLPRVLADAVVLRRIVENLVSNAVDSIEGAGTITVATSAPHGDGGRRLVTVRVSDTGIGMTQEELDRAFQGFYTTKQKGTGLGLSVVRRLVLDLNGSIRVETEPGAGTTFEVEFPATTRRQ